MIKSSVAFISSSVFLAATMGFAIARAEKDDTAFVRARVVIAAVAPAYPSKAIESATSGDVLVDVYTDESGNVTRVELIKGDKDLSEFALDAASRWKFESDGSEMKGATRLVFSFRLITWDSADPDMLTIFYPPNRIEIRHLEKLVDESSGHPTPVNKEAPHP